MTYKALPGNWTQGTTTDGHTFYVKHYDNGSPFGIDEGRVSKLEIRKDGRIVTNYDRGWDIEPADATKAAYTEILAAFN